MNNLDVAARWLRDADHIAVLSGAGISAESGIPTFRDALDGYWSKYNAEELATPQAFERNPELVSRWYDERRQKVLACEPNAGHRALVGLEAWARQHGKSLAILTQNVDGLHRRAGSTDVVEVHGSLLRWRSTATDAYEDNLPVPFPSYPVSAKDGGLLRPGVVWFGENLPEDAMERVYDAIERCAVFLAVGTSGLVFPAAGWALQAKSRGARTIELNRDPTPLSASFDLILRGKAGEILPELVAAVQQG